MSVVCYITHEVTKCQSNIGKGDFKMREMKSPEVRKAEIMQASKKLFYEKGYLKTTTQDIINELKISRGLLYYHFDSKEDILYYIVEEHTKPLLLKFSSIANNKSLKAKEKVKVFIDSTIISESTAEKEDYAVHDALQLPGNTFMMDKINHKLSYHMSKCFSEIIKEGNEEGIFDVEYPEEVSAYLMTAYTFVISDKNFHNNELEKATNYLNAFKLLITQTLNSKELLFEE